MDSTENGLMFVKINGCHICSSNNYEGETDRSQLCCKVHRVLNEEERERGGKERREDEREREREGGREREREGG